ncbi:hypothetical protein ALC62_10196 [Cyphomyrmex costatus]|uniref:Uncharacterized protein n=1 Tax=Cyphomyrmex costatus TaxID=456900 RepID=A0A195CE47_9HYME|nr:hypothetical protein ALC62_10196 [Cyphomyrmex costatus]
MPRTETKCCENCITKLLPYDPLTRNTCAISWSRRKDDDDDDDDDDDSGISIS